MAKARNYKNTTSYTYESVDGSRNTIHPGQDGVTEELIIFLQSSDRDFALQDRSQQENTSYDFQNAVSRYDADADHEACGPWEKIADPSADIMSILFPDEEITINMIEKLRSAITYLTDQQKDLVNALYHAKKTVSEIAREQGVTPGAIQDRRRKIFERLRKILDEDAL